jgi:uncharacterized protein with PIN domain
MPANSATLRFHGELNDFLPAAQRGAALPFPVGDRPAVKYPIETLGVPHPEVAGILVNGTPVGFGHRLQAGDAVEVFPQDAAPPAAIVLLRPPLPRPARFALDTHLGRLAAYLRMLGVDAWYRNEADDALLAAVAADEERVLLSRDRGLLKRSAVIWGYCPRSTDTRAQLLAVIARYQLQGELRPWRRCLRCNGLLAPVEKAAVLEQLEPKTRLYYDDFQRCAACGQVYWQGSHHARMDAFLRGLLAELGGEHLPEE